MTQFADQHGFCDTSSKLLIEEKRIKIVQGIPFLMTLFKPLGKRVKDRPIVYTP